MARGDTYTAASSDVRECGEKWWHMSIGHLKKKMTSVFVWKLWQELVHSCLRGPPTQHSPFPRGTQACVCPVSSCPMCHKRVCVLFPLVLCATSGASCQLFDAWPVQSLYVMILCWKITCIYITGYMTIHCIVMSTGWCTSRLGDHVSGVLWR